MNLTFALNLPGDSGAAPLPEPMLPGTGALIEALPGEEGIMAAFAELLAGLTAESEGELTGELAGELESDPDPAQPQQLPQSEAGESDGTMPAPQVADRADLADGKALPVVPGKILPDAQLPLQILPLQALPGSAPAKSALPEAATTKPPERAQKLAQAPIVPDDTAARDKRQAPPTPAAPSSSPVPRPLHLQLSARTLAPEQANAPRAPVALGAEPGPVADPPEKILQDGADKSAIAAPATKAPRKTLVPKPTSDALPQHVESDARDKAGPLRKSAKTRPSPSTASTPIASQSSPLPTPHMVSQPVLPTPNAPAADSVAATPRASGDIHKQDFDAVVQRLSEAREAARPGEANLRVLTREFGHVAMQFEMAGRALKVSLTSQHADFAPTVQAALAERGPLVVAEAVRAEATPNRGEHGASQSANQQASANTGQPSGQGSLAGNNGQAANSHNGANSGTQNGSARTPGTNSNHHETDGHDAANARDDGLFA